MIEIKNRFSQKIMVSGDCTLIELIQKHKADLSRANLYGADLSKANLYGANLSGANGNMKQIKSIMIDAWPVTYTTQILQIGCQRHPIEDWKTFDDNKISKMHNHALNWWKKYKELIFQEIELSPAEI